MSKSEGRIDGQFHFRRTYSLKSKNDFHIKLLKLKLYFHLNLMLFFSERNNIPIEETIRIRI